MVTPHAPLTPGELDELERLCRDGGKLEFVAYIDRDKVLSLIAQLRTSASARHAAEEERDQLAADMMDVHKNWAQTLNHNVELAARVAELEQENAKLKEQYETGFVDCHEAHSKTYLALLDKFKSLAAKNADLQKLNTTLCDFNEKLRDWNEEMRECLDWYADPEFDSGHKARECLARLDSHPADDEPIKVPRMQAREGFTETDGSE